jgi:hypothetical protein
VDSGPKERDADREWEIGEPLRRSIRSLPMQPGQFERYALSEVKPLAEDALTSLTHLERRRQLTDEEHRQAGALQRMLEALKEAEG